jgi:hypothetical protein
MEIVIFFFFLILVVASMTPSINLEPQPRGDVALGGVIGLTMGKIAGGETTYLKPLYG